MSIKYDENKVPYIDLGDGYQVRLETEEVTDDLHKDKAKTELRESPETIKQGIMELKELLAGKHLQFIRRYMGFFTNLPQYCLLCYRLYLGFHIFGQQELKMTRFL